MLTLFENMAMLTLLENMAMLTLLENDADVGVGTCVSEVWV